MKKKRILLMGGAIALASLAVAGCGKTTTEERIDVVKTTDKKESTTDVKDNGKAPVTDEVKTTPKDNTVYEPTVKDIKRVMQDFPDVKEFQEKLAEVNITKPVASQQNVAIAGNGVKEYKVNIDFYKVKDTFVAVYSHNGKIESDLPESVAPFTLSQGELEERLGYTLPA